MLANRTGLLRQSGVRSNFVAFSTARRVAPLAAVRRTATVERRTATVVCAAEDAVAVQAPAPVKEGLKGGRCHLPFQRGSPFKVRRVLDVIRGRPYEEALVLLEYMPYKACERIIKVLMSAAANAKNNAGALKSNLIVKECFADGGPCYKRVRPRAQGRGGKILKPTYHLTVRVEEKA